MTQSLEYGINTRKTIVCKVGSVLVYIRKDELCTLKHVGLVRVATVTE
jgi:hypothetical protein